MTTRITSSPGVRSPSIIVPRRATFRLLTGATAIALWVVAMNTKVALSDVASCGARLIGATLV